jgi:hypothetical protein
MRALVLAVLTGCSLIHSAAGGFKPSREEPRECNHKIPGRVDAILAVPFAIEAIVFAGVLSADTHSDTRGTMAGALAVSSTVAGLFIGSAVYGSSRNAECEAGLEIELALQAQAAAQAARERDEAFAALKAERDKKLQARELGKRGNAAARADDCATVVAIDPQLCTLDADYRDTVFVKDVAVARCLGEPKPCPKSE